MACFRMTPFLAILFAVAPAARASNTLMFVEAQRNGVAGVDGLAFASAVAVSPDGAHVYATGFLDNALVAFSRDASTGMLTFVEVQRDGVGGVDGLGRPHSVALSPDGANVYVALSDIGRFNIPNSPATEPDPRVGGGLFALRLENGERVWFTPPPPCGERKRCSPAQSAAVSAIPGVVFSGSVDGHLRAFSTTTGAISVATST